MQNPLKILPYKDYNGRFTRAGKKKKKQVNRSPTVVLYNLSGFSEFEERRHISLHVKHFYN